MSFHFEADFAHFFGDGEEAGGGIFPEVAVVDGHFDGFVPLLGAALESGEVGEFGAEEFAVFRGVGGELKGAFLEVDGLHVPTGGIGIALATFIEESEVVVGGAEPGGEFEVVRIFLVEIGEDRFGVEEGIRSLIEFETIDEGEAEVVVAEGEVAAEGGFLGRGLHEFFLDFDSVLKVLDGGVRIFGESFGGSEAIEGASFHG